MALISVSSHTANQYVILDETRAKIDVALVSLAIWMDCYGYYDVIMDMAQILRPPLRISLNTHNVEKFLTSILWKFEEVVKFQIKLDTSKKLLLYSETDKERECLVVRSTLSEMYTLHHAHCYHSLVTRCLCERLRLDVLCEIRCDRLEPTSPNQNQLAWDEWRDAHEKMLFCTYHIDVFETNSMSA
ncbi:hypothetical protein NECAME_02414 [Necator americanus]|uniref:Uncharacterized protein n=1 Tax=Necator americanus TaxID=51031 RepID=W2TH08_NECAM|nr:hypothetical protein NECAME_02414 [Necator americanus]ETN80282.1 hypothetical protein NECAME_02414 [Necator americanus]